MTKEEKAKAYDEALERARRIKNGEGDWRYSDLIEIGPVLTEIFPQLREGEDERIRKALVDLVSTVGEYYLKLDCRNKMLTWLEKQKNLISYYEEKLDRCACENLDKGIKEVLNHPEEYGLEKQKEQKPNIEICPHSVNSKSYSEIGYPIEDCDYGLEIALNILEKTIGKVQGFQTDDGIREHQTAIKAVKDAMKEQKPAEWSKNDTVFLEEIIDFFENKTVKLQHDIDMYAHWLKSLPERFSLQPKQEWSKEDETMRNLIIETLDDNSHYFPFKETKKKMVDWLKSLSAKIK